MGVGGGGVGGFGISGISGRSGLGIESRNSFRRAYTVRMGQPTRVCHLTVTAAFPIRPGSYMQPRTHERASEAARLRLPEVRTP